MVKEKEGEEGGFIIKQIKVGLIIDDLFALQPSVFPNEHDQQVFYELVSTIEQELEYAQKYRKIVELEFNTSSDFSDEVMYIIMEDKEGNNDKMEDR